MFFSDTFAFRSGLFEKGLSTRVVDKGFLERACRQCVVMLQIEFQYDGDWTLVQ